MTTFHSNGDFARFLAEVADALAEYDTLPTVDSVTVSHRGIPLMGLSTHRANVPLAHAQWGAALGHPVRVELRDDDGFGTDRIRTEVMLRGIHCTLEDPISREEAERCLAAADLTPCAGAHYLILAADLLSVLDKAEVGA